MIRIKISNEDFDYHRIIENIAYEDATKYRVTGKFKKRLFGIFKRFYVDSPYWFLSDISEERKNKLYTKAFIEATSQIKKILTQLKVAHYRFEAVTADELGDIANISYGRRLYKECRCIAVYLNSDICSNINLPEKIYGFILIKVPDNKQ